MLQQPSTSRSSLFAVMAAAMAVATATTVAAPLLAYSVTLATFGAAHVLSEFRYVDRRFGRGLGSLRTGSIVVLLVAAATARALGVYNLIAPPVAVTLELSLVVLLALSAASGPFPRTVLAVAIASAIGVATALAPFDAAIALAVLHNLTPLAFLWEILPPHERRSAIPFALGVFVALPLLVATGLPRELLSQAGIVAPTLDPFRAGPLAAHLRVYVPAPLLGGAGAIDLFAGAVVAQCAHYAATIVVLPLLLARADPAARGLMPWPRDRVFVALVGISSLPLVALFATDFAGTRALYGILASVHAWIEIPLVAIAVTRGPTPSIPNPTRTDAALATSETSSAFLGSRSAARPTATASTRHTRASLTSVAGQ